MVSEVQERKLAIFTIVSNNYFHFAKTLFSSVAKNHPEADFHVIIVDEKNESTIGRFNIINVLELDIPNLNHFLFRYNILEANTAVKPWAFDYIFKKGYDSVIYLDPDIYVYKRLDEVIKHQNKLMVITPHVTEKILDDKNPNEDTFLRCGSYNLGFIALNKHEQLNSFLDWWKSKLEKLCLNDFKLGLFVDQKWIDLVVSLFNDVIILKDKRYNMAYWNIFQRLDYVENVVFFHFSGIRYKNLSVHQNRIDYSNLDIRIKFLCLKYLQEISTNDKSFSTIEYKYNRFNNGELISNDIRKLFNNHIFPDKINPFEQYSLFNNNMILENLDIDYIGFYDNEPRIRGQYVWSMKNSGVKLPKEEGLLTVFGLHDPSFVGNLDIDIILDGEFITSQHIDREFFEIAFNIPESNRVRILNIVFNKCFIPSELGLNNDGRELASRIGYVSLNQNKFLDFSRDIPYHKSYDHKNMGINSIGYSRAETGVGQVLRYFSNALENNINNIVYPISDAVAKNQDNSCSAIHINNNPYCFNIFFMNGDEYILSKFGFDIIKNKYNIGYWFWELEDVPHYWFNNEKALNEIWVSSNFNLNSFSQQAKIPCVKIPIPVEFEIPKNLSRFDIKDKFKVLMIYDKNSVAERKNPLGAIEVFMKSIGKRKDTVLIIKTNDELISEYAIKDKIIIINENLTRKEIYELQNSADCYISLHRSEGFGLNIAESMFLGKPTIATNWSGNTDYMDNRNSFPIQYDLRPINETTKVYNIGSRWAEPDLEHAIYTMKKVYGLSDEEKLIVRVNAMMTMKQNYSNQVVFRTIQKRLNSLEPLKLS